MSIDEYINLKNNKFVEVDGVYPNQCWDLVEDYAEKVLEIPKDPWAITLGPLGAAKEAWTVFDAHLQKYFTKIPKGQEQRGDILVYDGHGTYTEGHIAIYLGGGQVFEQNADPDHSPAHIANRATTYLLGALRKKGEIMDHITRAQEVVCSIMQTGSKPGSNYDYRFTGLPLTQANLDAMLNFWQAQKRPNVSVLKTGLYEVK